MKNEVRIIAGQWRGRKLHFPALPGLRPTPARVRETLFNWLREDLIDARCLDLFAGSGALGFEAASRGARVVVQVEAHPKVIRSLERNRRSLEASQIETVGADAIRFLKQAPSEPFDVVFLDPPFEKKLIEPCATALEQWQWLSNHAFIYIEAESQLKELPVPGNWRLWKSKTTGDVGYHLFSREVTRIFHQPDSGFSVSN
ncbi:MAG: 16S rRNA (guanine(966)-N(2))-methyltransferase RsmD [Methylothermaceae bacteria B42]|nr:MAG: 16S rRNA (guanine(966)-N(2))-methyltransferase RsmD [Methylothermaceae bacteria B42]HHJ39419.1 16S rRNA (guanine(966)-N(2))-methyltransferase RsmD [Methylothermaceae bacterium]